MPRSRIVDFEERDTYISDVRTRGRAPPPPHDDVEIYERRVERSTSRGPQPARRREPAYDEIDVHIRERSRDRESRVPYFMREDARRPEPGPMVVRQREVVRRRSPSPGPQHPQRNIHIRSISRERVREPPSPSLVSSSPSPPPSRPAERVRTRIIERGRSPSREVDERIRIVERRRPSPSPSPPPEPKPKVIKGPTIEREVITHYRDIDHGTLMSIVPAKKPQAPSPPPRPKPRAVNYYEDDIHIRSKGNRLSVDVEERRGRAQSVQPAPKPKKKNPYEYDDEAETITRRIDSRGRMGEAWGGATRDWTIVDVPPGTERVRMDGVGGASAEVQWQKYSGVRRSRFIPEREWEEVAKEEAPPSDREERKRGKHEHRVSVQIYDDERGGHGERVTDRRISIHKAPPAAPPPPPPPKNEMWTEITKDLVLREAIMEKRYEFEETEHFFYVMKYLKYDDVLELVQLSDKIRARRKERVREIEWEREVSTSRRHRYYDDDRERVVEREVIFERPPVRGYLH